ncbi:hypothetical protein DFH07DRAFT_975044 [Mycena maculata]|uniref:Bromo domain-containing protein n=1 Tax=Mycena maculata TaxID=230809 RepID=A0AAD7H3S9_9AGAR|nr:hypothetical protein DFH07DRAFT_975044 [Mycena maculata]
MFLTVSCDSLIDLPTAIVSPYHGWVGYAHEGGPSYYVQIKHPQCFGAIFKRLKQKGYLPSTEFANGIELVFSNAIPSTATRH